MFEPIIEKGDLQTILSYIAEGSLSVYETLSVLERLASKLSPESFVNQLPTEIVEKLREASIDIPPDPEDVLYVHPGYRSDDFDYESYDNEMRSQYFLGGLALHNYFHPHIPIKEFEPRKLIGIINEIEIIDNKTVIIGDFESWMIRKYPIEIVDSTGKTLITNPVFRQLVANTELILKDIKQLERFGLWLEDSIKPTDIEIGSEVWVTRKKTIIKDLEKA